MKIFAVSPLRWAAAGLSSPVSDDDFFAHPSALASRREEVVPIKRRLVRHRTVFNMLFLFGEIRNLEPVSLNPMRMAIQSSPVHFDCPCAAGCKQPAIRPPVRLLLVPSCVARPEKLGGRACPAGNLRWASCPVGNFWVGDCPPKRPLPGHYPGKCWHWRCRQPPLGSTHGICQPHMTEGIFCAQITHQRNII